MKLTEKNKLKEKIHDAKEVQKFAIESGNKECLLKNRHILKNLKMNQSLQSKTCVCYLLTFTLLLCIFYNVFKFNEYCILIEIKQK